MQTFLPSRSFKQSARILDYRRLGKQRVEAAQIYNVLTTGKGGWKHHPAVKMWYGYEDSLAGYHNEIVKEWILRGYVNNMLYLKPYSLTSPPWVTRQFINSHRSNLLRKDPDWYGKYGWNIPDNIPYVWPV
jgi:hypothetical protein